MLVKKRAFAPTALSLVAGLLALLVTGMSACRSGAPAEFSDATVTVTQLRDSTQAYLGQTVTVGGTVARVFGEDPFSMNGQAGSVLVVFLPPSAEVQPARSDSGDTPVTSGEAVRVTGQVRRFAGAASERDADQDVNIDYKDDNSALVARTGTRSSASSGREP